MTKKVRWLRQRRKVLYPYLRERSTVSGRGHKTEELRGSRCSSSRNKGSLKQIILIDGRCFG